MVFVFKFTETLLVCLLVESLFKVWGFFLSVFYFLLFLKKISAPSVYTLETRKNSEKYCRSKLSYYSRPPPIPSIEQCFLPKEGIQQTLT